MIIRRYPTPREKAVRGAEEMRGRLRERRECDLDSLSALSSTLDSLNEEGFIFDLTGGAYREFKKIISSKRGFNVLGCRDLYVSPSEAEAAKKALEAGLDDIAAQKLRGLTIA
jgi:ribosomal protein S21